MEEVEICIPVLNEEDIILLTLDVLIELCNSNPQYRWKIVVVDNGSTDATASLVQSCVDVRVSLLKQPQKGKGAALVLGAQSSQADYFAYIDSDLSADPKQIIELLQRIQEGADIVVGSRLLDTHTVHRSGWRTLTSYIFKSYADILVPVPVVDSQCGLKVMNKRGVHIFSSCIEKGWFVDRELLAKAQKKKLTIVEVPIRWEEFRYENRKSKLHVLQVSLQSIKSLWRIRKEVQEYI